MNTPALATSKRIGVTPTPEALAPGKPTVSETSDAIVTSVARPAAAHHETASSISVSCAPTPIAAVTATTSSTVR